MDDDKHHPDPAGEVGAQDVSVAGTLDLDVGREDGPTSVDVAAVLTVHLDGGVPVGPAVDALTAELEQGLVLDLPLRDGVTLHQAVGLPGLAARVVSDDPDGQPVVPWDTAHTQPQVTAVVTALRDRPRPVPLWVDTPEEAEVVLAALHTFARLAPCGHSSGDCHDDEAACLRHEDAERLMERLAAAVIPATEPEPAGDAGH